MIEGGTCFVCHDEEGESRERTNDNAVMHPIASKMSPLEMAAVAEYLSGN